MYMMGFFLVPYKITSLSAEIVIYNIFYGSFLYLSFIEINKFEKIKGVPLVKITQQ